MEAKMENIIISNQMRTVINGNVVCDVASTLKPLGYTSAMLLRFRK
ncbi:MAG: hypothetical protein ACJAT2_002290 [Bacteriovoracaceae bacterium]|jgi:hypothetical protein